MFAALPTPTPAAYATSSLVLTVSSVPFYSQFNDITSPEWKKKTCGIASLAMLLEYYTHASTSPDTLLQQARSFHGYIENIGWTYKSLIEVAALYGIEGEAYDFGKESNAAAFANFKNYLADGPVMVSIHYKFDPKSTIPHLVVINGIQDGVVYYNDPAAPRGSSSVSVAQFLKGWKKRFIVLRPDSVRLTEQTT